MHKCCIQYGMTDTLIIVAGDCGFGFERKGAYVKELSDIDNNLPIVNKALVKYISEGVPVEDTINSSNDMIDFQQVVRVSKSFKFGWHNGRELSEKTYRVYASKNIKDTYIARPFKSSDVLWRRHNCQRKHVSQNCSH